MSEQQREIVLRDSLSDIDDEVFEIEPYHVVDAYLRECMAKTVAFLDETARADNE